MINLEMANSHKLFSFLPVLVVRTVVRVLPTRWRNVHLVLHASIMGKNRESAMEISVSALFYPKLWVNMKIWIFQCNRQRVGTTNVHPVNSMWITGTITAKQKVRQKSHSHSM